MAERRGSRGAAAGAPPPPRIFVGDVQGCADEFDAIVDRAERELGGDFGLWQVGDLVNRGPYNLRVLRRMRERVESGRGCVVLGNHDLSLIQTHLGLRTPRPNDTTRDVLDAPDADDWIEWLRRRPLVATGSIDAQPFVMVHAAVPPTWSLEEIERAARRIERRLGSDDRADAVALLRADPKRDADRALLSQLTTCRSVDATGAWSSEPPRVAADAWHRRWAVRGHDYGVVYGHWSLQRLHVAPGLRGLDTGCVHHGRGSDGSLTAWLPETPRPRGDASSAAAFDVPDDRFWSIRAFRSYTAPENEVAS